MAGTDIIRFSRSASRSRSSLTWVSTSASARRRSVAFWAAIPRWLSRSTGMSVIGGTRIDTLGIRKVDRADRQHLHGAAHAFGGHRDHGGDATIGREGQALDHLLVGDDLIGAGRQLALDAADVEWMFEGDGFSPRADGHARLPFTKKE